MACLGFSPSLGIQGHHQHKSSNAILQECTCRCSIPNSNGVELSGLRLSKIAPYQINLKMGYWPLTAAAATTTTITTTTTKSSRLVTRNCWGTGGDLKKERKKKPVPKANEGEQHTQYVNWFREAWPYIQGHRGSTFVLVIPGEVVGNRAMIDCILQDVALIHGLGIKLVIVPGTHIQIDKLLHERGHVAKYRGAYRITDGPALEASMEAAGRIRVDIEAKLSRGLAIPILRRHGENDRWHEVGVSVASGNYVSAKPRGVVGGVDFKATGEVKKIDVVRIRERLNSNCIVMLSNLGYSGTGEVLSCNTYEVATACAIALQADKLLCLLDGQVKDEHGSLIRFMTLQEADELIHKEASQSNAAAEYVKAVAGAGYMKSLGIQPTGNYGDFMMQQQQGESSNFNFSESEDGANLDMNGNNGFKGDNNIGRQAARANNSVLSRAQGKQGFAIGGEEMSGREHSFLSELAAAVYVCRGGVRRVHLLDSHIQGALLLELYTRDGIGTMVSSDMYEGTRDAQTNDVAGIEQLLRPLVEGGVVVDRPRQQLLQELQAYTVVERDGCIIACAALFPFYEDKSGEVAAFAVSPDCRGHGRGDSLLDFVEKKAMKMGLEKLFILTTRTADWFVRRGFSQCSLENLPDKRQAKVNLKRGSKYYMKNLKEDNSALVCSNTHGQSEELDLS